MTRTDKQSRTLSNKYSSNNEEILISNYATNNWNNSKTPLQSLDYPYCRHVLSDEHHLANTIITLDRTSQSGQDTYSCDSAVCLHGRLYSITTAKHKHTPNNNKENYNRTRLFVIVQIQSSDLSHPLFSFDYAYCEYFLNLMNTI